MSTLTPDSVETAKEKQYKRLVHAFRDQQLAIFWAACACAGAFAIWLSHDVVAPRLLIPVAIMFFFAWQGYRHAKRAPTRLLRGTRIAQLADSLYFLGFLWTLWALIDSFVFKQMPATEAVFRTFGYALVTTATGMFLRLLLLQFKYWAHDQVPEAEKEFEVQIEMFTRLISETAGAIGDFRVKSDAALGRWIRALDDRSRQLEKSVASVEDQTTTLKTDLETFHGQHLSQISASACNAIDAVKAATAASVVALTTQAGELASLHTQQLGQISASTTRALEAVRTAASSTTSDLGRVADARLRSVADTCERGAQALETGARSAVESFNKALQPAVTTLVAQVGELSRQAVAVRGSAAALDALWTQRVGQFAQQVSTSEQSIARATQDFAASVVSVNASLAHVATQIARIRVPDSVVESAVERVVERRLPGLSQPLRSTIDELTKATHELAKATTRLNAVQGGLLGWLRRLFLG